MKFEDDDDALLKQLEAFRAHLDTPEECKRQVRGITDELRGRIAESQKTMDTLEEHLSVIRENINQQMLLLKDLELEKIDRSMHYQKIANAYQNWRQEYHVHRVAGGPPSRMAKVLLDEQEFLRAELESHVGHIIAVSNNVHRLREMKDVIERKIADKKRLALSDKEFLKIRNKEAAARPSHLGLSNKDALQSLRDQ